MSETPPPWTELRDSVLERLVNEARPYEFYGFRQELLEACAAVVAASASNDLVFVGRSPENLYDLLSALFKRTRRAPRLSLAPFSMRTGESGAAASLSQTNEEAIAGLQHHFSSLGLLPADLAENSRSVSFVDCVGWGTTLCNFEEMLEILAERQSINFASVSAKIRYIGLTKSSLGWTHWRNDEKSKGVKFFEEDRATVVPLSSKLWNHLADWQPKTLESYGPDQWAQPVEIPSIDEDRAAAISLAVDLRRFGRSRDVRRAFAAMLSRLNDNQPWLSSLIGELLKSTQLRRGNR